MIARASAWRAYSARMAGSCVEAARSPIASRIGAQVADRDALAQEVLQDALHLADARACRGRPPRPTAAFRSLSASSSFFVSWRVSSSSACAADRLGQVRDDHRLGVDDGVAERLGLACGGSRRSTRRAARRRARSSGCRPRPGIASPGSIARRWPGMTRPRATSTPRTLITYSCESSADVVVDPHRGDHDPELGRDLAADDADAGEQRRRRDLASTIGTSPKPIASSSGSICERADGRVAGWADGRRQAVAWRPAPRRPPAAWVTIARPSRKKMHRRR